MARQPVQKRSKERVDRLLEVAMQLIAEAGSDALRMSDVAEQSGVSIGSLYQYFPDKTAIIRVLAERYNALGRACVAAELEAVKTSTDLKAALPKIVDGYYDMFMTEPVMRDIWFATQADKSLQKMDAEDGRAHGHMLMSVLRQLYPKTDAAKIETQAFLTMHLIASTVRLAITLPKKQAESVLTAFKQMLTHYSFIDSKR